MDKFPEAYRRFEKAVDTKDAKKNNSFEQLRLEFQSWNTKPYLTHRQERALGVEAEKRGISPVRNEHVSYVRHTKSGDKTG